MPQDQTILFALFAGVFAMLLWGRWRYDIVAFCALLIALILGVVPTEDAFSGFGHPATIIVALVLIVSRGLQNSGAIDIITRRVIDTSRAIGAHITVMASTGAILSAFMNNVAALALLMPVDIQAASKAGRSIRATLMPLSFATILGGLVTLIGTPPNIIIAQYRETTPVGEPFQMFDFAPVGLICATIGILFVALIGWRLVPGSKEKPSEAASPLNLEGYIAELVLHEKSKALGMQVKDLYDEANEHDLVILGVVRNNRRLKGFSASLELKPGDMLLVEASAEDIDRFRGVYSLEFFGEKTTNAKAIGDLQLTEVLVTPDTRIVGSAAIDVRLRARRGVALLGISRKGKRFSKRVRHEKIRVGDILLLIGPPENIEDTILWLSAMPLAERGLQVTQHRRAWLAAGIFAGAIALASFGVLYLAVALAAVVALYVLLNLVPIRNVYDYVEWPVIVLLGSMLPLGTALEKSGGTALLAEQIVTLTAGYAPWIVLTILMVVVMTLSDVLNNTATAVIGAPIAVDIANRLGVNSDPFLMAVAIAASCAFLTPIGHKNNTLIMGPGGYNFGDYWKMGLPLEIIVIAAAVPAILVFWPL
ncbi:MAG: SLC13 family permease [Pseudomonadota bacterium]